MNNRDLEQKIQELVQQRKRRKRWYKLTAVLAAAAMVVTAGSLILPAMTMEKAPEPLKCQLDLHAHEESCYGDGGELLCGYADFVVHEHDASCYDEEGVLICPLEEIKAHTHSISCYEETRVLTCGMEEGEGHTHNASCYGKSTESTCGFEEKPSHVHTGHIHNSDCYQITRTLTCGQAETRDHTHTSDCYETTTQLICDIDTGCYDEQGNLICGLSEGEGHTHAQDCYPDVLLCGKEEVPAHSHSDACYQVVPELVCGKEEIILHTHTPACYDREGNLICGQIEVREHVHDETCLPAKPETIATPAPSEDGEEVKPSPSPSVEPEGDRSTPAPAIDYEDPEAPQSPAPGQEGEVEASPTPEPEWKPSPAPEPEEEEKSQASPSPAPEEGGEESAFPVMSGSSWATVSKPGYDPVAQNRAARFSANALLAAPRGEEGYDFADNITSVTVAKEQNGQWVPGKTFTVGDKVQVVIAYSIPADIVTKENKVIYYQLPQGIGLTEDETGDVTIGDQVVGTYTITTYGLITITFQDNFADGRAFEGSIQFQGTVDASGEGEEDTIIFGGEGGTITVEPDAGDTDLSITKSGTYDSANEKIHYTVTVSSEQGSDGPITVNDKFLSGGAICDNNIGIRGPDGPVENAKITYQNARPHFTISELPALEAGKSYTITYTATVNLENTGTEDGSLTVRNRVEAQDQTNTVHAISDVLVSEARIWKTGVYNPSTREVVWTVYIYNPHRYDLEGKTLRDTMTWTYGEKTLTQNIESATLTPYIGETPGEPKTINLPYEFPENSTQNYILTYTTSLPEGADEGANLSVTNTAWLGNWKAVYTINGTVPGETGLVKAFTGQGEGDAVESDLNWSSIITFPQGTLEAGTPDSVRYVDIIMDAIDEDSRLEAGTHYTTRELLQQMVVAPVEGYTQLDALIYGTDYTIQVVTAADFQATLGETYYNASGVGFVFGTVAFDQLFKGFSYEGEMFKFTWSDLDEVGTDTPIAMFAVTFTSSAVDKLNEAGQISISYSTHYDLSKGTRNGTYTLANGGRTPSNSAAANTETALLAQLNKQVSTIGGHDYALESDAYTDGPAEIDVGDTDGNIYYRILLYNFGDEISLQDTMWAEQNGGNISVDSIQVYDPITGNPLETLKIWGADGHFGKENDYYGIYNLKNLAAYRGCIIGLYYHVDVSAQVAEGETETITNTVNWIGVDNDSATAQVTNSGATLEKTGEALEDGLVRYYVTINPSGRDLLENGSTLTLTDTLTLSANSAAATFLPETAKLYLYDAAAENNLGEDISERLSLTYEEETHTITFTLPDQVACVVVYEYEITRGAAAGNIDVSNTAQLTGVATTGSGSELVLTDQSSGATVNSATLRIYKHEAGSINTLLSQAHFTLERYEKDADGAYKWTPSTLTALEEDGSFIVKETGYIELNFLNHAGTGSLYNTLYRLKETQAPEGYAAEEGYRYFVWMEQGKDETGTYAAMQEADALPEGVDEGEVTFIAYSTNGAIYVPNEPLTTSITVEKQWQGAEGTELGDEEHPAEVKVTLYQQTAEGEPEQYTAEGVENPVTLNAGNDWTHTWAQLPKEDAQGNPVTYTVEETPVVGWEASYDYGEGATGITEGTIQIINTKQSTFTLPETGGVGPTLVAIAGVPLIGAAGVAYRNLRRKRRRGGKTP